ncbi:unnamed protein product [Cuscuta epithymum]|uniref:Uncharacterized protein n=1 Tax=Cuscuta epithymum TaxID=186058 RepID=A0AAV0CXT1_9ASTE|nr:unnamed protein product [Cuscuta epithymum]
MLNFVSKTLPHLRPSARSSLTGIKLYVTKARGKSANAAKKESFVVSYLIDKCGFAPEKAFSASKRITFKTPDNPDSVLSFLKTHGFSETQISKLIQRCPSILSCHPQNTLLPKIEFLKSVGFTVEEYTAMLCGGPSILQRSLGNQLLPTIEFLKQFFSSPEQIKVPLKRSPWIFSTSCQALMEDNIELLRRLQVPELSIVHYVQNQPRLFTKEKEEFKRILEDIKGMGFDPSKKLFMVAVHVASSMTRLTWEKKMRAYKKWGLSADQILETFVRNPWIMACSEEKILRGMDFFVNKLGLESSDVFRKPVLIMLSLEKRIIPRCLVYQALAAEGLLKDIKLFIGMFVLSEAKFVKKFVKCYENRIPDLPKLYHSSRGDAKVHLS